MVPHELTWTTRDMTDLVHKKRKLSVNLLRFLRHVVPMRWPGQAAAEASRYRAGPQKSVISVWTHLGGQWAFLMWFPAAPDSFTSVPAGVEFTPCGLASVCSMCGCSCAGGDNKRQDRVGSRKGEPSVDSHRVWSSRVGWEWLGWRRARTELVHQKRALGPCELAGLCLWRWARPVSGVWFPVHGSFRVHHGG